FLPIVGKSLSGLSGKL
uniref:Temporin n=1 Tax=Amolops loloensis TaxID=318551 RepID=TPAMO_AMOLO|nr:RecName: Full=Temporin; AltName: Full=Amolopin [Amolops loloensis]